MRVLFIFIVLYFEYFHAQCQEYKRNYNWVVGFDPAVKFEFENSLHLDTLLNPNQSILPWCALGSGAACISDLFGRIALFSNGYILYDKFGFGIENGVYVNCPQGEVLAKYYGGWSNYDQISIILPKKNNTYYVFSTGMSDSVANNFLNGTHFELDILNYSVVEMDANNGKGKVIDKNKIILDKQHYTNCALTAVKHANGRDWWLVKSDCINHQYQTFLVQPDTILGPYYEQVVDTGDLCTFYGQIYFSDDGTKFATSMYADNQGTDSLPFYNWNRVELYDFDRCTGKFTFRNVYKVPMDTASYPYYDARAGICFSPNGKLLYMSNRYTIYQIDLEDNNINNGQFISGPDTTIGFPRYRTMACGPNGKLYIGNNNGTRKYMSYIDKPNTKGLGCTFKPNGVYQPYTNLLSPPNMANYGLGKIPNSPCDTIKPPDIPVSEIKIYPNPVSDKLTLEFPQGIQNAEISIYNMLGQRVYLSSYNEILNNKVELSVRHLARALYSIKIVTDGEQFVGKFVRE
jgi:hypothetical protein